MKYNNLDSNLQSELNKWNRLGKSTDEIRLNFKGIIKSNETVSDLWNFFFEKEPIIKNQAENQYYHVLLITMISDGVDGLVPEAKIQTFSQTYVKAMGLKYDKDGLLIKNNLSITCRYCLVLHDPTKPLVINEIEDVNVNKDESNKEHEPVKPKRTRKKRVTKPKLSLIKDEKDEPIIETPSLNENDFNDVSINDSKEVIDTDSTVINDSDK